MTYEAFLVVGGNDDVDCGVLVQWLPEIVEIRRRSATQILRNSFFPTASDNLMGHKVCEVSENGPGRGTSKKPPNGRRARFPKRLRTKADA